jgi:hypothetical protein
MSPDRNLLAAIEESTPGAYYATNHDRLVFINTSTGARISTLSDYFGEWNMGSWSADSSRFLYMYHTFDGSGLENGKTSQYTAYSNLTSASPTATAMSATYMGQKADNIPIFTKSGNLLSLSHRELYNGQTGALIADRSADVPEWDAHIFGIDGGGDIYFANRDKSNFRRFIEFRSPYSCVNNPVRLGDTASYYSMIYDAYSSASGDDSIKMQVMDLRENLDLHRNISVTLKGGYGCDYSSRPGYTTIHGDLIVSGGTVIVEYIKIN